MGECRTSIRSVTDSSTIYMMKQKSLVHLVRGLILEVKEFTFV
ncbi:hypothetical protein [Sutcliffiella halmapala]|nr:hypothetical protein [Sutcliffiella halmapala]